MKITKTVDSVGTITELKRIASAYVIDYRGLSDDEIRTALKKTAPQYYYQENVEGVLNDLFLADDRNLRVLSRLILENVLLQKDDFICAKRETEDDILAYEQSIINRSNEDLLKKTPERSDSLQLFKFVLETAWEHNASISPDERNLIEKLRIRLKITTTEHRLIEAKLSKFPKKDNELHTRGDVEEVRRVLQSRGLLFAVRDEGNTDFDVVPEEVAKVLRVLLGLEMREHGYRALLAVKYVRSKKYLLDTLTKNGIGSGRATTIEALQDIIIEQIRPTILLGGLTPRDGLDIADLRKWCSDIGLPTSGLKSEIIERVIDYYDALLSKDDEREDDRQSWYAFFEQFAARELDFLRHQQLILKDLECEARFEEATNYLFETRLFHKPLQLVGTAHADGALSYQDKVIFWDNKSKETPVSLQQHIRQFDGYIKESEKPVACFIVIGPQFTADSGPLAMQYLVQNQVTISLITASELKELAERWYKRAEGKEDPFPLGYLIQPGRFNPALLPF